MILVSLSVLPFATQHRPSVGTCSDKENPLKVRTTIPKIETVGGAAGIGSAELDLLAASRQALPSGQRCMMLL
jgi:hypothetical protein